MLYACDGRWCYESAVGEVSELVALLEASVRRTDRQAAESRQVSDR